MKIIEVMGMKSSKYGGLERFIESLINKDSESQYWVWYNAPISSKEYELKLRNMGVEIVVQPISGFNIFIFAWRFFICLVRVKPDVVHVHFDPAGYVALLLSYLLGVKKRIKTIHSSIVNTKNIIVTNKKQLSIKTYFLFKLMCALSTDILCVSNAIKKQLSTIWGIEKKVSALYLGVEIQKIDLSIDEIKRKYDLPCDKLLVGNVAFHDDVKGIDLLLKSLYIVKKSKKDVCLVQIGQFKQKTSDYVKLASELGLDSDVIWLGLQNNVQEILSVCDVYTQPSRSEGIPLAIMEASSVAIPTVAYRVGGIVESCVDNLTGKLVAPLDYKSFARELLLLLENNELRRYLGDNALSYMIENFSKANSIKKLIDIYRK